MIDLRREQPQDQDAVRHVNTLAFESKEEALLVDRLRSSCEDYLSFVAVEDGAIIGHILFTPVTVDGTAVVGMGLAPMSVLPSRQRAGIGSQLVRHGLEYLREAGCPFVIVLGHPEYYPRFGFQPASTVGLSSQWDGIPNEAFMSILFDQSAVPETGGVARYHNEFEAAM